MFYLYLIPIIFLLIIVLIFNDPKISERKMTMVILSNDKTICAEYNRLTVQRNYGNGKDKKYALIGSVNHHSDVLNSYPTKEEAVAELEKIYVAYQNGDRTYSI